MEVRYFSELVKQGCLTVSSLYFAALGELPGVEALKLGFLLFS